MKFVVMITYCNIQSRLRGTSSKLSVKDKRKCNRTTQTFISTQNTTDARTYHIFFKLSDLEDRICFEYVLVECPVTLSEWESLSVDTK